VWEERSTYRGKLKTIVEANFKAAYPEIFEGTPAPNQAAQQGVILQRVKEQIKGMNFAHIPAGNAPDHHVGISLTSLYLS